jgi:acetyl esterase/lipase
MLRSVLLALTLALALATPASARAVPPDSAVGAHVLLVHGGGWTLTGPGVVARMQPVAARLRRWGYGTVNVEYRPAQYAFADVAAAYDRLRARVGARAPVCVYGASAGAQMALMLAVRRPEIACVVAQAPPALLAELGPRLRGNALAAFGLRGGLLRWSPARYALEAPVLLEHARQDRVVPLSHSLAMQRAARRPHLSVLRPGMQPWVHTAVAAEDLARAVRRQRRFLQGSVAFWAPGGPFRITRPLPGLKP